MVRVRRPLALSAAGAALALVAGAFVALPAAHGALAPTAGRTFSLFPASARILPCLAAPGKTPKATVTVVRGAVNDTATLKLSGVKSRLGFDLFTVQKSNQLSNGSPDPAFTNFGLAWYQSDVEASSSGTATVTIKTILLDQIFGFDAATGLAPTNTFHMGFWFNKPSDAAACGFTGPPTPFNGEHNAGPLAMISRPLAGQPTNIGPLCTRPLPGGKCHP